MLVNYGGIELLNQNIESIMEPIPSRFFESGVRPTVGVILRTLNQRGVLLVQHAKSAEGVYLPPQGGILPGESLMEALLREIGQELPDAGIDPKSISFLGDAPNDEARERVGEGDALVSEKKHLFWGFVQLTNWPTTVNEQEIKGSPTYAYASGELIGFLSVPGVRPKKRAMVIEAIGRMYDRHMLHTGFASCAFQDLAAA